MSESEFRTLAEEYGYSTEQIDELVELVMEARLEGVPMKFEDIELVEQPVY